MTQKEKMLENLSRAAVYFLDSSNVSTETRAFYEKTLVTAAKAFDKFSRSGFQTTPPEILAEREATCRTCPEWDAQALNKTGRCRKCGCSTWVKLRMATERCPIGKWEAVTQTPDSRPSNNPNNTDEPTNT
jgi:hypothetical protein